MIPKSGYRFSEKIMLHQESFALNAGGMEHGALHGGGDERQRTGA
jgi:hypothetical protein